MRIILFFIAFIISIPAKGQKPTDRRLAGLDTFVARVLKEWKAPGVTIAIVEKNKVVYTGGFGYRDLAQKLPVTENTLFAIGSCTKAFTASLIGGLVKEGLVDLDKPIRNYLPELRFNNEYLNDHVTIRDMMTHRTGLPRHDYSWYGSSATRPELLKRIEFQQPTAELREKYQYNNFMFLSQGILLEKLTGKSWETNIQDKIFAPLGMSQTVTSISDMEKSPDHSLAYTLINDSFALNIPYKNIDAMGPAGSINSNAKDMAKWLITWINNGKYNGNEIIPSDHVAQASTIQMAAGAPVSSENPDVQNFGYGLAWTVGSYRGHYRVEHGGGIDGFISSTGFFPTDSIGFFISSSTGYVTSVVRNWICDRILGLNYRDWQKQQRDAFVKTRFAALMQPKPSDTLGRIMNTHPSLALSQYAGKYTNKGYGTIEISLTDSMLQASYNGTKFDLQHKHFNVFRGKPDGVQYQDAQPTELFFQLSKDGKIDQLSTPLQPGVDDIEFTRDIENAALSRAELEKYAGDYQLGPQNIQFVIRDETKLFAILPGQPNYELVSIGNHEFKLKILEGYKVKFKIDDQGVAAEASFIQPNGIFVAKRK